MREPAPYQPSPNASGDPQATQSVAPTTTATLDSQTVIRGRRVRSRSVLGDVSAGLFLGDFATDLGLPGAITQVAVSFVPLIGSTCAMRDLIADLRHRDRVGAMLNALALAPIIGGFSKTFEVIRSTAHIGHAMHISHEQAQRHRDDGD